MTPNQYRCETCKKPHKVPDGLSRQPHFFCCDEELPYDTAVVTTIRGCASHSDYQSERDAHWRDLFVSDLRSSIKWDAEHGNPELFKVVVTLDKHYNTFSVEQHDKQVRDKVLDELVKFFTIGWFSKSKTVPRDVLLGKLEELRQAGEQG